MVIGAFLGIEYKVLAGGSRWLPRRWVVIGVLQYRMIVQARLFTLCQTDVSSEHSGLRVSDCRSLSVDQIIVAR
jgi:hypothetical protein